MNTAIILAILVTLSTHAVYSHPQGQFVQLGYGGYNQGLPQYQNYLVYQAPSPYQDYQPQYQLQYQPLRSNNVLQTAPNEKKSSHGRRRTQNQNSVKAIEDNYELNIRGPGNDWLKVIHHGNTIHEKSSQSEDSISQW